LTSISPEALRAAVGEIKEVVHSNDEVVDELGLTTFPEGMVLLMKYIICIRY
jgi:hypothetical protein